MKNIAFLIGITAILFSIIPLSTPAAAQVRLDGWYWKEYAPTDIFRHNWNGTRLEIVDRRELWRLYSELMMMPGMPAGEKEWVEMRIMWDPQSLKGEIIRFEHYGMNLHFTGWTGTIEFNNIASSQGSDAGYSYHFQVSGRGYGSYRVDGVWYNLIIWGCFKGVYIPDNPNEPLRSGRTEATERATLFYGLGEPPAVGGEVITTNISALPHSLTIIAIAVIAVCISLSKRWLFLS